MTNWEKICSNKEDFIVRCTSNPNTNFYDDFASDWWCKNRCPGRVNGECTYPDDCLNDFTSAEVLRMWLDEECEEET